MVDAGLNELTLIPGDDECHWSILDGDEYEPVAQIEGEDREQAARNAALMGASLPMYLACCRALEAIEGVSIMALPGLRSAGECLREAIAQAEDSTSLLDLLVVREANRLEHERRISAKAMRD